MAETSDLFQLIQSLSMSEKRYFKIFASRHVIGEENNYVKLFDAVDSQKESNDSELKKMLKNSPITKNLPKHKHYLYNLILRCLNAFHTDSSSDARFREMMRSVEILFEKGLYKQCWKILKRAKEIATQLEKIPEQLAVAGWEQNLLSKSSQYEELDKSLTNDLMLIKEFEKERLVKKNVYSVYSRVVKMGIARSDYDIDQLRKLVYNPILFESKVKNFWSKHLVYVAHSLYFNTVGDYESYHESNEKIVDLFESKPQFICDRPNLYVISLNNFCNAKIETERYNEITAVINKLRSVPETYNITIHRNTQANIVFDTNDIEVVCCLKKGEFEKAKKIIEEAQTDIEKNKAFVAKSRELNFYYDAAYTYFIIGQHHNCLKWLNRILNDSEIKVREELHSISKIFSLIVHFELGNFSLIDYIIRSTYGQMLKHDKLFPIEHVMIKFFRETLKMTKRKNLLPEYLHTRTKLQQMLNDPYEKKVFDYFDFMAWIECKVEEKTFKEVLLWKIKEKKNVKK
jgi:tetratricopeptide (TPR) repeat protein